MAASTAPSLGLKYAWGNGADGWDTEMDANLYKLDTIVKLVVKDYTLATPPVSPANGDKYAVAASPTGAWASHAYDVAIYKVDTWVFYTPVEGWMAYDQNSKLMITFNGSVWRTRPESLNVFDYIDKSQHQYILDNNTASQNATLVTAGVNAALADAQAKVAKLDFVRGSFLLNSITIDGMELCKLEGNNAVTLVMNASQTQIIEMYRSIGVVISGITFKGTATADGSYRSHNLLDIRNDCSFVVVTECNFTDFAGWGIVSRLLAGGTYTEGVIVDKCKFYDAPSYYASYSAQAGIAFGSDGEYSSVTNCRFYRIPAAARFTDGANGLFADNIVMQLNGGSGALQTDRAALYAESNTNNGKITISRNKFNHNETGLIPIIVKGDLTKPQNPVEILDNDVLVNGNGTVGYQLVAYDFTNMKIRGNKFRAATSGLNPCIRLNDCDAAIVDNNYFRAGTYALQNDGSVGVQWGMNICESLTVDKITNSNGGTTINRNNRSFVFKITSAGAASTPWDDDGWTVAKTATGQYTVTHNMGSLDYGVIIQQDAATVPSSLRFSCVRATNTFDVYIVNGSGVATDANVMLLLTVGNGNNYAL